ncbi:ferritin-like protein [Actinomadura sp. GTD37]|uniref:ferritin-like domain-containing protein n=1 Tax=Actinomadura sp. GTD37 TaxID=1778030 RepID=UPI0035C009B7
MITSVRGATLESLRAHLQWAIELEHATLPPYLCALYSLDPARNPDAAGVMRGVFAEGMLRMALAANLLNAVGGRPRVDTPRMLPPHPRPLPHGDGSVELSLRPFGPAALEMFLRVERPAPPGGGGHRTIGRFYGAVEEELRRLCAGLGERLVFRGDPARQVTAGRLTAVRDLASALAVLKEIAGRSEGTAHGGVAPYHRFLELRVGRRHRRGDTSRSGPTGEPLRVDFTGVHPMRPDPRPSDHAPTSPIRLAQEEFDRTYCAVLHLLDQAFDGSPEMFADATGAMSQLEAQARALIRVPDVGGTTAGLTFEYFPPEQRRRPIGPRRRDVVLRDGHSVVHGRVPRRRNRVNVADGALTQQA